MHDEIIIEKTNEMPENFLFNKCINFDISIV